MTTIQQSDDQAVADDKAHPNAANAARADAILIGVGLPKVVASVWNEAHALYLALRREYSATGPEITNFDNAWTVWTADTPNPNDPEGLAHAKRALLFYKKANSTATSPHAKPQDEPERLAYASRALAHYWELGADLARLASNIEATRPTMPEGESCGWAEVPVGTEDELKAHLNSVEASLAKISAGLEAVRGAAAF